MMSFKDYYFLCEALRDISTDNKLYHQTNAFNLFKILESGYLSPSEFTYNLKRIQKPYASQEKLPKELAVGRKSLYSKLDSEKDKGKTLQDFPNFGGVRFKIFSDRLKSSNTVRNTRTKPIAEYSFPWRNSLKETIEKYKSIDAKEIEKLINVYTDIFFAPNHVNKGLSIKAGALKQTYPFFNKFTEKDFNSILSDLKIIHDVTINRESEERIEFKGKNKVEKNELFSDYKDRLYLNADLMEIELLPSFSDDFFNSIAPYSFIKYYNKMKQWKSLFEQNNEYKKITSFLRSFINGKVSDEEIISKVKKEKIEEYLKKYNRKSYIPSADERQEERKKYNYKTGGKKLDREELEKEILSKWKKHS